MLVSPQKTCGAWPIHNNLLSPNNSAFRVFQQLHELTIRTCKGTGDCIIMPLNGSKGAATDILKWTKYAFKDVLHLVYKPDEDNQILGKGKLLETVHTSSPEKFNRPTVARLTHCMTTTADDTIVFAQLPRNNEDRLLVTRREKDL